jgi:uncharacterized protein (TIGR02594 family)
LPQTPRWYELAVAELGTREVPGSGNAPKVVEYYQDAVEQKQADSVPWCAAFVGAMLERAGERGSGSLMARSYLIWGEQDKSPSRGTICVFGRGGPRAATGHVAFLDKDNGDGTITVLGGNQSDAVTRARRKKKDVLGYRWPKQLVHAIPPEIVTAAKKMMSRGGSPMATKKAASASMTTQEIMTKAKELYDSVDTTFSIGGVKKSAKAAASLIFYMAQNMLPPEAKAVKGPPVAKALNVVVKTTKAKKPAKRKR